MILKEKLIVILIAILMFISCNNSKSYLRYEPIKLDETTHEFIIVDQPLSQNQLERLKKVLEHYNKDYQEKDGELYIPKELCQNHELIWNYQNKANNTEWYEKNIYQYSSELSSNFVLYHPIEKQPDGGYIIKEDVTQNQLEKFKKVLEHYNKDYQEKDGELYIPKELYQNQELIRNYQSKANNTEWCQTHIEQNKK